LFAHEAITGDRFPLLSRLKNYYADAHFAHTELGDSGRSSPAGIRL